MLLDYCLTTSVLNYIKPLNTFVLNTSNKALIQDVDVISHVLLDWRVWQNAQTEVRRYKAKEREPIKQFWFSISC